MIDQILFAVLEFAFQAPFSSVGRAFALYPVVAARDGFLPSLAQ